MALPAPPAQVPSRALALATSARQNEARPLPPAPPMAPLLPRGNFPRVERLVFLAASSVGRRQDVKKRLAGKKETAWGRRGVGEEALSWAPGGVLSADPSSGPLALHSEFPDEASTAACLHFSSFFFPCFA